MLFDIATSTVAELRHTCMALAEAVSEPGHPFNPDQVMLKGHKLNPGQYGTHTSPPETCSQYVDVSLGVLCTPSFIYEWTSRACPFPDDGGNSRCPFINKGVVCLMRSRIHSTMWWNDLRRLRGEICPTSMACESDESFEETRRPANAEA